VYVRQRSSHKFTIWFQAGNGILVATVTGVQTCAHPNCAGAGRPRPAPARRSTARRTPTPRPGVTPEVAPSNSGDASSPTPFQGCRLIYVAPCKVSRATKPWVRRRSIADDGIRLDLNEHLGRDQR